VDEVVRAGVCDPAQRALYGRGRVALYTREAGGLPRALATLRDPRFRRIAIANPEHAPYGRAAREALLHAGLWEELAPRIVYAENVRQAHQLARSGEVEAALVALALVIGAGEGTEGTHLVIEERLHTPIEQELVACTAGANRKGGRDFAAYVGSAHGREVLRRYGFLLPGEPEASRK
jgi:molybdate transport system substrate-binding protein